KILFNFLKEPEDRRAMREGIRIVRDMYSKGPLGEMIERELKPGPGVTSDADLDAYVRSSMDLDHHPTSTCAMGTDAMSVVDPELKVRGVQGLRVVDASAMPRVN